MFENLSPGGNDNAVETYVEALRSTVDSIGRERVAEETDIRPAVLQDIASGDTETVGRIHLSEVAAIVALENGQRADAVLRSAREELLFEMSTAVTDVEALAARVDTDLDPKEIQAKMEGRFPMTLAEYARLRSALLE